jgi:putative flippase GtrA
MENTQLRRMAVSATLHCLLGCSIGEIAGLVIGTALNLPNFTTFILSIALAFVTGYTLSTWALVRAGVRLAAAVPIILAADTLSIFVMEITDNAVMASVPGAMNAGLNTALFWFAMALSLAIAFIVAVPVNYYLLRRGKGHALVHEYHGHHEPSANHQSAGHGESR